MIDSNSLRRINYIAQLRKQSILLQMEDFRSRLLVFEGTSARQHQVAELLGHAFQVESFTDMSEALRALRENSYHAVFADAGDFLPLERALVGQQASLVLDTIGEGACVIDAQGGCRWSNNQMRSFSAEVFDKVKTICCQARSILEAQIRHRDGKGQARSKKFTFQCDNDRYFELIASPVLDGQNHVVQIVAVVWEATTSRRLQQKIDAIDSAGRELARLDTEAVTKLAPDGRLQLLQDKIIRYSRDLMHFDHFTIRLVDARSTKLEVVIAEGMPGQAIEIDLYANPEGNGISGFVAATGRSYICHDTEKDSRYVLGIDHAKSSLTVPLWLHDKVIGIFNIESETVGTFNEEDRQFAEIFGRSVALALNMLQLLVVERCTISGIMADSVVQEVAQPINDIMTDAQNLMEEYIGDDAMRHRLGSIVDNAQMIRDTVSEVAAGPKTIRGSGQVEVSEGKKLFAGKRVLIADDEMNIRNTLSDILVKHGCECTVCKDGYEAINRIEQEVFDLILSDIKMPHRNGYEIFAAARRRDEDIPVILMTGFGYDPNHSIVRATGEGLGGVIFKPFKVDQLLDHIRKSFDPAGEVSDAPADSSATPDH